MSAARKLRRRAGVAASAEREVKRLVAIDRAAARAVREAADRRAAEIGEQLMAAVTMALRDKFGFGQERMTRLYDAAMAHLDAFDSGAASAADAVGQLALEMPKWRAFLDAAARGRRGESE